MTRHTGRIMLVPLILTVLLACSGGSSTSIPVTGNFTGSISGLKTDIALRADGQTLDARTTDGTSTSKATVYLSFDGPMTNNAANLTDKHRQGTLTVTLNAQAATGTIIYKGNSFDFNAEADTDPPIRAGLYLGEQTVSGVPYQAGWVVLPTPPEQQEQREAIINEQTGALLLAPALTAQDIASGQVAVPGLGVFILTLFPLGQPPQSAITPTTPQITITPTAPQITVTSTTPVVNFIATLNPSSVNCSQQAPGQLNLLLDNTGSNVDVTWALNFQEMDPYSKTNYWGSASSNNDTVPAGQQGTVVITPSIDLCQATARTYHLQVSYTPTGLPQQSLVLNYIVIGQAPSTTVNFIATLNPSSMDCPQQVPGQSNLLLDNTGSNVDVTWALNFQEMNPSQTDYWGSASSNNGTVPAGQQGTIVITLSSDLCKATQTTTYHLQISYTPLGLPQQSLVLNYTVNVYIS